MHPNPINPVKIAVLAALVAVIGASSTALAAETGYGQVQLVTTQQIDDPPGACTTADSGPAFTYAMAPEYPAIALEEGQEGFATVTFTMALDGSVSQVKLSGTSGNRLFDRAAVEAVRKSRFAPATHNCGKIAGLYGVPVVFSQSNSAPEWPNLLGMIVHGGRLHTK